MQILGLHHLQLTIPAGAEKQAREFYVECLGLREIPKPASLQGRGGFWLSLGDQEIHIGTEEGVDRHRTKAHVAFQVDDLQAWRERLESIGCPILGSIPIPGIDRFEFRDPFGNRLEMLAPVG